MKKIILYIVMLHISTVVISQSVSGHVERAKVEERFKTNQNLKVVSTIRGNSIIKFVYDSTTNELFKIAESDNSKKGNENHYSFNSEQLYYARTEVGINFFFNEDFYLTQPLRNRDENFYNIRETIISKSYKLLLAFRNYINQR